MKPHNAEGWWNKADGAVLCDFHSFVVVLSQDPLAGVVEATYGDIIVLTTTLMMTSFDGAMVRSRDRVNGG